MIRFLIQMMYLVMFAFAAIGKLSGGGVPEWFIKQFGASVLNAFPGALTVQFFTIALIEAAITVGILISLARQEFLPSRFPVFLRVALISSAALFIGLSVGLRLVGDFNGASQLFVYFIGTLGLLKLIEIEHKI